MAKMLPFLTVAIFFINAIYSPISFGNDIKKEDSIDYIIITTDELKKYAEEIATWKEDIGHKAEVITVSWIYKNYDGRDRPEKIRNFLIDRFHRYGIKYVLIVGSIHSVPMEYLYPVPDDHSEIIPTDYYYEDLKIKDWDADGDGYPGEYEDDIKNTYPDIILGRIPFDDGKSIERYAERLVKYELDNGTWKKTALLMAAILRWNGANPAWCIYLELYTKKFLINSGFSCTTLYEKEGLHHISTICDYPLNKNNVIQQWKNGYGLIIWGSHGSSEAAWRVIWDHDDGDNIAEDNEKKWIPFIESKDANKLGDEKPSIVWGDSCNTAYPEDKNSLGASLLRTTCVAYCGSARGGAPIGATLPFCEGIVNGEKIGDAYREAQVWTMNVLSSDKYLLGAIYSLNYYGDPSLSFYLTSYPPTEPSDPYPPDGAINVGTNIKLNWSDCSDPEKKKVVYDVYLGDDEELDENDLIATDLTESEFMIHNLKEDTRYYWRVVAKSESGLKRSSKIWSFYTVDTISPTVKIISPEKGYIYLFGKKWVTIPLGTIIIGGVNIRASSTDNLKLNRMELYIDGELEYVENKTNEIYYAWDGKGIGWHEIKVIAYDEAGNFTQDQIKVFSLIG